MGVVGEIVSLSGAAALTLTMRLEHFVAIKKELKFIATIQVLGSTLKVASAPSLQHLANIVSVVIWSNH